MIRRLRLNAALDHFAGKLGYRASILIEGDKRTLCVQVPFERVLKFEEDFWHFFNDEPNPPERPPKTGLMIYRIT